MSSQRSVLEDSSSMSTPPPSPWRVQAEKLRHRPVRLRQAALVLTALAVLCSFILLSRQRQSDAYVYDWISTEDTHIPLQSLYPAEPPSPQPNAHDHRPQHGSGRPPQTADDQALSSDAQVPKLDDTRVDAIRVPVALEPIIFSLIMFSEDSANEGAILIKSILMYSSKPVQFHIICDETAQAYLEERVRLIERPARDILVRFYRLSLDQMQARLEREGAIVSDHSAGIPGLMKLFIHEILPESITRTIFVDTDAIFISDPALLWDRLDRFSPSTAIAMPSHPDQDNIEWHQANRICSCIMLLDLARLRALHLMDSHEYRVAGIHALAPARFEAMFGAPGADGKYRGVKLGDQGYWWAIVSQTPEIFEHLSYDWEASSCLMDMYGTALGDDARDIDAEARSQSHTVATPHEGEAVLPKMLHFNCLDGTPHYYKWEGWSDPQNSLTQRWYPAVQYHVGYKWVWLNAHRPLGKLIIETQQKVVFWDELFAERRGRKIT